MAIRNYEFLLSASDIEPSTIQHVGVQYEHNATEIIFVFPKQLCDLLSATADLKDVVFRVDVIDGEGGYHPSESIEPKIKDDGVELSYCVGYDVASIGGVCRLCVVASRINDENREDMIYCSAMARVEFENVYRNERQSAEFERGLNGIVNEAKGYMIASTEVNENGKLLIYYANGAFVNAGKVTLPNVDKKPTKNSQRPVASGGVYDEFENIESNINNKFSNAVAGMAYGSKVYIDDISPIEHDLAVRVDDNILPYPYFETSKSDVNGLVWVDNDDGSIEINGYSNTLDVPFYLYKGAFVLSAGEYVFTLGKEANTNINICIYGDDGLVGWTENGEDILLSLSKDTTITEIYIYPDGLINFENVVISPGLRCTYKTELKVEVRGENYFAEYAANSNGTVDGIKSIYPAMELSIAAPGGRVLCEYNRDIGVVINELEELIDNIDGASVEIVDNLTSYDTDKALSANQGRWLLDEIETHRREMVSVIEPATDNNVFYPTVKAMTDYVAKHAGGGSVEVIDNLESEDTDKALSANMGKVLNDKSNEAFKTLSAISDTKMVTGSVISLLDVVENTDIEIKSQDSATKVLTVGKNLCPTKKVENFTRFYNIDLPVMYPAGEYDLGAKITLPVDNTTTRCLVQVKNTETNWATSTSIPIDGSPYGIKPTEPFNRIIIYAGTNAANAQGVVATFDDIYLGFADVIGGYEEYVGELHILPINELVAKYCPMFCFADDLSAMQVTYRVQKKALSSPNAYYFNNNYLPSKIDTINQLIKSTAVNGDSFIFITDQHLEYENKVSPVIPRNAGQSTALIKYINDNTAVNKMFVGGDVILGNGPITAEEYADLLKQSFNGDIHYAMGNHDYALDTSMPKSEADLYYLYDINKSNQIGNPKRHYYYVDNQQQKMRYIVLNGFMETDNTDNTATDIDEQNQWLKDIALQVESGWGIILFAHYFYGRDWRPEPMVAGIAASMLPIQTTLDEYEGNGEIIAVIHGHIHQDMINHTTSGIPVICTTCDKYVSNTEGELLIERTKGTITEQAFDVVVVDRTARKIHCVRIGAPAVDGDGTDTTNLAEIRVVDFKAKE